MSAARVRARELGFALALWVALAASLSLITGRARDWFDMTDELRYERLAASIARTHSLVPRIHGALVESWAQLYPALIAPAFHHATAPADVHAAHLLNACVMSSATIPAFLLARRVTGRTGHAYVIATLSVVMPWVVYSTMLMTEVAAYPAFLWAAYLVHRSIATPSRVNDLLALAGLGLAFLGRTALLTLAVAYPIALVVVESRRGALRTLARRHDVLVAAYVVLAVGAVVLEATGNFSHVYGIYAHYTAHSDVLSTRYGGSLLEHYATFSLGLGILPFVLGAGWALSRLPQIDTVETDAFAWFAAIVLVVVPAQVTDFDVVYNLAFVHDRFLIYLVPLLLIGTARAVSDHRRLPRWAVVLPAAVVGGGFAVGALPAFTWQQFPTLNPDTPASILYRPLVGALGSLGATRALLVGATVAFALGATIAPRRLFASFAVVYTLVALPLTTYVVLDRYFTHPGWSGRAVTANSAGSLDWVDAKVSAAAAVAIVPYPVSSDWFVSQQYWRDLEFWNRSVTADVHYPEADVFEYTGFWFPKTYPRFDTRSGTVGQSPARYVVQAVNESRFRLSGPTIASQGNAVLIDAGARWRLDWLANGLYDDGWTKPGTTARVRVYAQPSQSVPVLRALAIGLRAPDGAASRTVLLESNAGGWRVVAKPLDSLQQRAVVCVPPHSHADLTLRAPDTSVIPGDARSPAHAAKPRDGGVYVSSIGLSDASRRTLHTSLRVCESPSRAFA